MERTLETTMVSQAEVVAGTMTMERTSEAVASMEDYTVVMVTMVTTMALG